MDFPSQEALSKMAATIANMSRVLRKTPQIADVAQIVNKLGEQCVRIEVVPTNDDRLMTLNEAAKMLGTSKDAIYGYLKSGALPAQKLPDNKWTRVWRSDVMALPQPFDFREEQL